MVWNGRLCTAERGRHWFGVILRTSPIEREFMATHLVDLLGPAKMRRAGASRPGEVGASPPFIPARITQ